MSFNMKKYSHPKCELVEGNVIQPDWELLKELLYFQSPSATLAEKAFVNWLSAYIKIAVPTAKTHKDKYGNLYITKGESTLYPCIVAHADTVQDFKKDWAIFMTERYMFGFDNETGEQCGMGADDKVGISFILQMLKRDDLPNLKAFIPVEEELGCRGSKQATMNWFKDCSLLVQLDRRSDDNDISEYTNGVTVVSEEFIQAMSPLNFKYGYSFAHCVYTDVGELKKRGVNCVAMNISCGYFNEHMDNEIISLNHYTNAINFSYEIIKEHGGKKWIHKTQKEKSKWVKSGNSYWDTIEDYADYYLPEQTKDKWNYVPNWTFQKDDEKYIADHIKIGTCALCESNLHTLKEGEQHCFTCESTYDIPYGKSIRDVEEEIFEILESKEYNSKEY